MMVLLLVSVMWIEQRTAAYEVLDKTNKGILIGIFKCFKCLGRALANKNSEYVITSHVHRLTVSEMHTPILQRG